MLDRRTLFGAFVAVSAFGTSPLVWAAQKTAFTPEAFAAAQKAGDSILVEITAPWCPTCKAQKPILGALTKASKFNALKIFEVDFDSQKSAVSAFGARMQSTLIAFKGRQEMARSVGDTKMASISDLLDTSI